MKTVSPDSILCLGVFLRSDWSSDPEDEKNSSEFFEEGEGFNRTAKVGFATLLVAEVLKYLAKPEG
jgi:hypothetical protein